MKKLEKNFLFQNEIILYKKLNEYFIINNLMDYNIVPQVQLNKIFRDYKSIDRPSGSFNRFLDFVIFDSNFENIIAMIELNGKEHKTRKKTIARDNFVKSVCKFRNYTLTTIENEVLKNEEELYKCFDEIFKK